MAVKSFQASPISRKTRRPILTRTPSPLSTADAGTLTEMATHLKELVNQHRTKNGLRQLDQSSSLNNLAQMQAKFMAQSNVVESAFQDNPEELQSFLNCAHAGENIQCGTSVFALHVSTIRENGNMLLSCQFDEFGLGIARGTDGQLFVCHLFRQQK